MIRLRKPERDDDAIVSMVRLYLLPFKRIFFPKATVQKKEIQKRLRKGLTFVTVAKDGKPDGFCHVLVKKQQLWIDLLAVEKASQGMGKGSALLRYAEQYGKRKGCRTVRLYVDETNPKAQRFYQRHGYTSLDYVQYIHCYLYEKPLNSS